MKNIVVYIHGKGGSAAEAVRYRRLFADSNVLGFDYEARTPWDAKEEFVLFFEPILKSRKSLTIVANSIGAFFAMHALQGMEIKKGVFYFADRKYAKIDRKNDVAGVCERGGAARQAARSLHSIRRPRASA